MKGSSKKFSSFIKNYSIPFQWLIRKGESLFHPHKFPRKFDEASKKLEERYQRIFEDSKDMVYVTSADGRHIDVNQAGVELLGFNSKEEMMQLYARDVFLIPEDRERFIREVTKLGFVKDYETKLKKKDGTPIDVLITANLRRDPAGKIIGYDGIIKDITDRKRMEEELAQKTKELETLYDLNILINQSLDIDHILHTAIEKAASMTGFEIGAIYLLDKQGNYLERKAHIGLPLRLFEDGKFFKYGEGVSGKAIQERRPITASIHEYSTYREVPAVMVEEGIQTLVGIPLQAKGEVVGAISLLSHSPRELSPREINLLESIGNQIGIALENATLFSKVAKVKSEWETTFNAVTDLLTIRDKDYRILQANRAAFERFRLKPEDLGNRHCYEMFYHRDQPCEGCYLTQTLLTKKPTSGEKESQYLEGIFHYYSFPIFNEMGEVVAIVNLLREITEEKRLEKEKELVNRINKILASNLDLREMIRMVRSELRQVMDFEKLSLSLFDGNEEGFRFYALEKDYDAGALVENALYPLQGTNLKQVMDTKKPLILPDFSMSDSWVAQRLLKEEGIRSALIFPLEFKGKIIGTLNFGSRKYHHFSEENIHLLKQIGPSLAISIQNALLFEETKKRLNELTILYEMMKISASSLNLNEMLREMMKSLNHFFHFDALGILLMDENKKQLHLHPASYHGLSMGHVERLELLVGQGITGWVAQKGEPLMVNDVSQDSRYICGDESIRSEMCVPMKVGQKVIGVIDVQSQTLNAFTEDDLRLLSIVGGQLANLIENIRLYEEIKKSEERYRAVIEGAHDGICVIGKDNRFKYVNKSMIEIQGYPPEELIGKEFLEFLDEGSKQLMMGRFAQWREGKKLSPQFELNTYQKNGDLRNIEINARVIKDSKGETNYVVFVKDITEKKKMEEKLLQTEKLRSLAEMASGVAHDFNNALAVILGNTQLLLYTVQDEEIKKTLRTIEKVSKDSAQTVRRLQDFTRKKAPHELFKVDVNSMIRDSIEITKPRWKDEIQKRGLQIEMVTHLEGVPLVLGNPSELKEVFTNLIFNAIEAMPRGGKIEIRTFQKEKKVFIKISDTGMGIPEEIKKKIFDPFFTTKPFTNTGLGLSLAYGIIKRLEGEIEVESKVGKGTVFTLVLPSEGEEKEVEVSSPSIKKGRKARILVIDDEEFVRNVLYQTLAQEDHQVTLAENGEKGIQLFKEKKFDMVLTDLGMPGMSGWDVCRQVKEMSPNTPVGMITGWGMETSRKEMEKYGLNFIISKPFDLNKILNVVAENMDPSIEKRVSP